MTPIGRLSQVAYRENYYSAAYGHEMTLLLGTGRTVLRHSWRCAGAVVDNAQTTWKQTITGNGGLCGFSGEKEWLLHTFTRGQHHQVAEP